MEKTNWIKILASVTVFCGSIFLVFYGQRNVGYTGLSLQFLGLFGLITLLYLYNRKYK